MYIVLLVLNNKMYKRDINVINLIINLCYKNDNVI